MRSAVPKHLHPLLGRRLVDWVIAAARAAGADPLVVVTSPDARDAFDTVVAVQEHPLGTGDAVRAARDALGGFDGDVLVLNGDVPGLTGELLDALLDTHRREDAAATVLSFEPPDVRAYGRIVRDADGHLAGIVEAGDASNEQLALGEVNSGIYVFRAAKLWPALDRLEPHNAQGELYVTDTLGFLVADGNRVAVHVAPDPFEVEGVNTRAEFAAAAAGLRDRVNERHMLAGVTIVDPATTWIEPEVEIENDVTIHPFVYLRGATRVASGAEIHANSVVVDAEIGPGATVGPFCYLRPGTVLEASSKAGTFVEIKNSRIGPDAKVPHLSYVGDAEVGEGTNVGAGAITANFPHRPGVPKGRTTIGKNVRTGVHNAFVAPVEVGDGAWTGAGSVITKDVPPDALAVARARQENKEGYAARHRDD
jgi:bifunctional UDP-N-acetylglucosamine pyrophosphorylase/glucosamine-1-phosphate N-acetyltransferase